jgi:hypothetical protein
MISCGQNIGIVGGDSITSGGLHQRRGLPELCHLANATPGAQASDAIHEGKEEKKYELGELALLKCTVMLATLLLVSGR